MQELFFSSQGTKLFAVEGGAGSPIVMLHGGMADHLAAAPFVAPLAGRYRVLTPDLRASGRSWYGGALSFDQLADDVVALLDHIGARRAVVGGASGGAAVALRCALRHADRLAGLVLVMPAYAGEQRGFTEQQAAAFQGMGAVAIRAVDEGVQVLRPLFAHLPPGVREQAIAMSERFDPASVAATGRFLASGAQPFSSPDELRSLRTPTLLVPGADPMHPAEVSELYAGAIPDCTVVPPPADPAQYSLAVAAAIGDFCERRAGW